MILTKILQPTAVKVPLESKDKKSAILELVDLLEANKLLLDKDVVIPIQVKNCRKNCT